MKMLILVFAVFFTSVCSQPSIVKPNQTLPTPMVTPTPQVEKVKSTENECKICDFDFANYKGNLKKEEVEGLFLALNDEYLAWAIYDQINKDFNNPRPFKNIQQSENRHAERLKQLFKTYNLPVPENPWIGKTIKFKSVSEACKAGVDAEIINKQLYDKLFSSTAREDILFVYRNLQRASEENHLPAFQRCGEGRGMEDRKGRG